MKVFGLDPAWYVSLEVAFPQCVEAAEWDFYFVKGSKVGDVESGSLWGEDTIDNNLRVKVWPDLDVQLLYLATFHFNSDCNIFQKDSILDDKHTWCWSLFGVAPGSFSSCAMRLRHLHMLLESHHSD